MAATAIERKLLIGGAWVETGDWVEVTSPYSGELVGRVAKAGAAEARRAVDAAERATLELLGLDEPPTAIFTGQNLLTVGAVRAFRQRQAEERTALIGFDDFPLADLLRPPVTVVAQDPVALGQAAARRLFGRLDGDESPGQPTVVPTRLIVRASGELRP